MTELSLAAVMEIKLCEKKKKNESQLLLSSEGKGLRFLSGFIQFIDKNLANVPAASETDDATWKTLQCAFRKMFNHRTEEK